MVGRDNRQRFSSAIAEASAQLRTYRDYFDDKEQRQRIKQRYGVTAYRPKLAVIVGKTPDIDDVLYKQIESDLQNIEVITYDDLVKRAKNFAHFFINSEMFPIYDSYADKMLIFHLGYAAAILDQDHVYRAFTLNFNTLKALLQFDCTTRELDKYLWLAGVYRKWRKNPQNSKINVDAHRLFVNASGETTRDLEIMMG